jgi:hypothetical protein
MLHTIFNALLNDNPFKVIDKKQLVTKENLIGRIKRFQSIMLTCNTTSIAIISNELTANTIAVFLAAVFLGKEIVFLSNDKPIEDVILTAVTDHHYLWFADATTISKMHNKIGANAFINVVNINNYAVKIRAKFVPLEDTRNVLDHLICVNDNADYTNLQTKFNVRVNDVVNVYDTHYEILCQVVLQSIANGATLRLRNQALKNDIVVVSFNNMLPILKYYNYNIRPVFERNILSDTFHCFRMKLSKYRLKRALNQRLYVFGAHVILDDFIFPVLDRPAEIEKIMKYLHTDADIELAAYFNLPIKKATVYEDNLYIVPDYDVISSPELKLKSELEEFKLSLNARYQVNIKHVVILP